MHPNHHAIQSFFRTRRAAFVAALTAFVGGRAAADESQPVEPAAIIGGGPVSACAWPSTVFLENCTGTLIHPEIVMYAAHCGDTVERVWFGEDISSGGIVGDAGFEVDTEYCIVNPAYATEFQLGPSRAADFAFCKLARPVTEVPVVPALVGCETTALLPGTPVTLVGYGGTDQDTFGVKFTVDTVLHYIDDWGAAVIGGQGKSPCAGDSGGPAFVQLSDGSWRAFAIVSGPNVGNCSDAMWFATSFVAIPFIEAQSGIDVTPCHFSDGTWNPSPACGDFPLAPADGSATSWADGCGGGPTLDWGQVCGPAFDGSEDLIAPSVAITSPEDRKRFDREPEADGVQLAITADGSDAISGLRTMALRIDGNDVDLGLKINPPWSWNVTLPPGVWELQVRATDWAGNEALSPSVVVGVDEDPPPAPEPSTSSGIVDDSGGGSSTTGLDSTGAGAGSSSSAGGSSESSGTPEQRADDDGGCGCTSGGRGGGWLALVGLVALVRRRRVALALALGCACADTPGEEGTTGTTGASSGPSSTATQTSTGAVDASSTGPASDSSSTGVVDSSSTGPGCEPGTVDCHCLTDFTCNEGLSCHLDACVACATGSFACPCSFPNGPGQPGVCDEGLLCFGGLCATPAPCPFVMDGECDEPQAFGPCMPFTDFFDCCAVMPDVCEEEDQGGGCPDGADPFDCCAVMPGVCEERSQGGACPDGSDPNDCGVSTTGGNESGGSSGDSGGSTTGSGTSTTGGATP